MLFQWWSESRNRRHKGLCHVHHHHHNEQVFNCSSHRYPKAHGEKPTAALSGHAGESNKDFLFSIGSQTRCKRTSRESDNRGDDHSDMTCFGLF